MPVLLYIALGFAGGCAVSAYVQSSIPAGILCCAAGLILTFAGKKDRTSLRRFLSGMLAGFLWFGLFETLILKPLDACPEKPIETAVTVTDYAEERAGGISAEGVLSLDGRIYRTRIYLQNTEILKPGDRMEGRFLIKSGNPKEERISSRYSGDGFFLTASSREPVTVIPAEKMPFWAIPVTLGKYSRETIKSCFPEDTAGFAGALFLGDKDGLPFETKWDFRISGISHLVAVSGLHVSVLCMLLSFLTLRNRWLTALLGFPALAVFAMMTGFSPSVVRACIMMCFLLLAGLINRRYDPVSELSAAMILMLAGNPLTIASASFQLSCASVLGIFFFYRGMKSRLLLHFKKYQDFRGTVLDWCCGSVALSCSSLIFVTPLTCLYFGSVSLIAPLTNLLVVALVPVIFWGILGVLILAPVSLAAGSLLGRVLGVLIRYVLGVSHLLAAFPLAAVFTKSIPVLIWLVGTYLLGWIVFRHHGTELGFLLRWSALGLMLALALSWGLPRCSHVGMTVLDVGQGQCILLQVRGKNFMVDCGGDRDQNTALLAADQLRSQGIFRLDGLILTHFDRDHVGGARYLLKILPAERIFLPEEKHLPGDRRIETVTAERELKLPGAYLTIIPGDPRGPENEKSLCVLLDSKEYDILITGDRSRRGELKLMEDHALPTVDCLVAGHHGAADSTCPELLSRVRPDTVVISAGKHNSYGHPAGNTLARLQKFGCQILRTDLLGTIVIRR